MQDPEEQDRLPEQSPTQPVPREAEPHPQPAPRQHLGRRHGVQQSVPTLPTLHPAHLLSTAHNKQQQQQQPGQWEQWEPVLPCQVRAWPGTLRTLGSVLALLQQVARSAITDTLIIFHFKEPLKLIFTTLKDFS